MGWKSGKEYSGALLLHIAVALLQCNSLQLLFYSGADKKEQICLAESQRLFQGSRPCPSGLCGFTKNTCLSRFLHLGNLRVKTAYQTFVLFLKSKQNFNRCVKTNDLY